MLRSAVPFSLFFWTRKYLVLKSCRALSPHKVTVGSLHYVIRFQNARLSPESSYLETIHGSKRNDDSYSVDVLFPPSQPPSPLPLCKDGYESNPKSDRDG
ncbi:hypothetical protein TNCT_393991 [Trichonephila clavata]|uniref:Uncharacterized protein n=1 Tax=Trichonephila clavata TaxID=2740835 RepID=A0A8X6LN69_TRICU|nr:hypothetical protein TNCT_393991 [Trichonephila clavata]